jgi:hypothetical protein
VAAQKAAAVFFWESRGSWNPRLFVFQVLLTLLVECKVKQPISLKGGKDDDE